MAGPENRPNSQPGDEPPLPGAPPAPEPPPRHDHTPDRSPAPEEPVPQAQVPEQRRGPDWAHLRNRVLLWIGVIAAAVVLYFLLASFLPRWWAQRMGDLVGGSFALGVWWGLFFGVVFTAIPILVIWQIFRRDMAWKLRLVIAVAAILLASPNLLTLSVVLGTNSAAHAGERILDVEAPAFRGASLAGAIIGGVIALALIGLFIAYRRRGRKIKQLEDSR